MGGVPLGALGQRLAAAGGRQQAGGSGRAAGALAEGRVEALA